ncbi:MAG: hypothetical protein AB7U85_08365 [Alphaproteobacteria bacterium]
MKSFYPTPEERAELVVKKLEMVIRKGRDETAKKVVMPDQSVHMMQGISYKKWQEAAKVEIAYAIRNAVLDEVKSSRMIQAFLMIAGSCCATLGFLGIGVVWGNMPKILIAVAAIATGAFLLFLGLTWFVSGSIGKIISDQRKAKIARINNLNEQIKKMESYLLSRKDYLKNNIDT